MSTDAKDISRHFNEEIINQKSVDAIDRFCAADFVDHNPPHGGKGSLDATKQQFLELAAAFPDLKMIVQDQIAEGDRVVNRVLVRGTHEGEYMGIPGSGKTVEIGGIDILRMVKLTARPPSGGATSMT
jgi:predicted ester cyclase